MLAHVNTRTLAITEGSAVNQLLAGINMTASSIDGVSEGLVLRDGSTASIRSATPADAEALRAFFERLSPDSRRKRFFTAAVPPQSLIAALCENDNPRANLTLLVSRVCDGESRIIATGSYQDRKSTRLNSSHLGIS